MNCLSFRVQYDGIPMQVSVGQADEPMQVSVGLICSVDENTVSLFSSDGFRLISVDGRLLYGKK